MISRAITLVVAGFMAAQLVVAPPLVVPARAQPAGALSQADNFAIGNAIWVLYHEVGHLLIDEFNLPVLGREEDAADHLATVVMLEDPSQVLDSFLVAAVEGFFLSADAARVSGHGIDFAGEHGLNEQRAFEVACLMLGSNEQVFGEFADAVKLPQARRRNCRRDYELARRSWLGVLEAFRPKWWRRSTGFQVRFTYGPIASGPKAPGLAPIKQMVQDARILEEIANYLNSSFEFKRDIVVEMKSCKQPNAFYQPGQGAVLLCYELVREFRDLMAPGPALQ
ncbi:MAG: DUF4344 domain-containing metallopeptidase [Hyphomicrobiales bacterium]